MKLFVNQGNFRGFAPLIAAEYCGLDIEVPQFNLGSDNKTAEFLALSPTGKVPVLETEQGAITHCGAVSRYIARLRPDQELCGSSFFESALVDSWIDFSSNEVELPASVWVYPVVGLMPFVGAATEKAKTDLARALAVLEKHLLTRTYLVGDAITLADIVVASALVYPFKLVMDAAYRKPFPCVTRWFSTCVAQAEFAAVVGEVPLCKTMAKAAGDNSKAAAAPAAGGKKKETKKAAKKEAEPAPAPKKKAKHPLAILDDEKRSPFIMDAWKKSYSNCGGDYNKAMAEFWTLFDAEGWSLWTCNYKYNSENTKMFMTCNAVSGFLQRTDEIRKWAFGVMAITGEEGSPIEMSGCFLFRSQSAEHMLNANPDAEYYEWTKVDTTTDAGKQIVADYWTADDKLHGKILAESKVFK